MGFSIAQKIKFTIKDFFSKCDQIIFTEEILNGKLHFLCSLGNGRICHEHIKNDYRLQENIQSPELNIVYLDRKVLIPPPPPIPPEPRQAILKTMINFFLLLAVMNLKGNLI